MSKETPTWNDVRRLVDELELKIHLAGMEARDRWQELQPRIADVEKSLSDSGKRATDIIKREVTSIGGALKQLLEELDDVAKTKN
ncbi:MAG TPA: hypothetical protein VIV40_17960 [Kofleriaceae bacterium]